MKIDVFKMERMQSTWENVVEYNLSESGVHPLNLKELLTPAELESLTGVELGYTQTNGTVGLREAIARLYPGISLEQILATAGSSEANFLLMWSLIEPGDEVLFELPNYMQMGGLLRAFGADGQALPSPGEPGLAARPRRDAEARHAEDQAHRPDQSQQSHGRRPRPPRS